MVWGVFAIVSLDLRRTFREKDFFVSRPLPWSKAGNRSYLNIQQREQNSMEHFWILAFYFFKDFEELQLEVE